MSNEEVALRSQESVLLFENQSVTANYMALCRYSRNHRLNAQGFNEALDKMLVLKTNLGSSNTVKEFYDSFQVVPGEYDAKKLKDLCVLLSLGTLEEKAGILFEIYDPDFTLSLDKLAIVQMAADLVEISTEKVAILVTDSQWKQSGQIATKQYIDRLEKQRGKAEDGLKQALLDGKDSVSKADFLTRITKPEVSHWLSTSGIRKILSTLVNERLTVRKHEKVVLSGKRPTLTRPPASPKP